MRRLNEEEERAYELIQQGKYEEAMRVLKDAWSRLPDTIEEEENADDD